MTTNEANLNIYSQPSNLFSVPDMHPEKFADEINGDGAYLHPYYSPHVAHELIAIANALVNPRGKGIYATDEPPYLLDSLLKPLPTKNGEVRLNNKTMQSMFQGEEEQSMKGARKAWKEFAYQSIPSEYISGVILSEEALLDFKLEQILSSKGIISGVRAHGELAPIPRHEHEFMVEGLDGLLTRLQAARAAGARFSKWRAPVACGSKESGYPSQLALEITAETLARYASISQQAGLVAIVEPNIEFSRDADLARSAEVHETIISMIYERMKVHSVLLEGTLIRPSYAQPGTQHPSRETTSVEEIARATATLISRSVPSAVPGVVFLSGGLSSEVAASYLAALNRLVDSVAQDSPLRRIPRPTFSYGRAIQSEALEEWRKGNVEKARICLEKWAKVCGEAAKGRHRC